MTQDGHVRIRQSMRGGTPDLAEAICEKSVSEFHGNIEKIAIQFSEGNAHTA